MTVIRPNSVSGITSITAQANDINFFRSNGTLAGLNLNGVNFNTTSGVSTFAALNIEGVLTYQDVTNVDSVGVITARSGIRIGATGANTLIQGTATGIALGTGTPRQKLHINASDSGASNIVFTNATTGTAAGDGFVIGITGGEDAQLNMQESANLKISTADTERLRITSGGRVGINQTTPEAMLQIDYDYANSEVGLRLRSASGSGTKTWQLSEINGNAGVFTIRNATNSYNILNIDGANQRVGINKTNPEQELHVVGDSDACVRLTCTDGGVASFQLGDASDTVIGGLTLNAADNSIQLRGNNNSERLRIDSSGRLLIGTTATDNRDGYNSAVQIAGTSGDSASMSIGRYSANISYPAIILSKSRSATINSHTRLNTGDYLGGIQFQGDDGTRFLVGASIVAQAASPVADYDMATDLIFSTNYGTTSPSKSMTLDQQGRLTKPNQPFVMVHIQTTSNRQTTGSYLVIPWDIIHARSTSSNVGSHFNTSNHRFTAPVDGRYLFVMSLNIVSDNIIKHRINGSDVSKGEYRDSNDTKWDHADASFIYDMNANDYYDCVSRLYDSNGSRFNGGSNGLEGWDTLSIYLLG